MSLNLEEVFNVFFSHNARISGSYVREKLVRKDEDYEIRDIDIVVPFKHLPALLENLKNKFKSFEISEDVLDWDEKEPTAHIELTIGGILFDIFSCEDHCYLSPPDFDVNLLCWTGREFTVWSNYFFEEYDLGSIEDIIERAKRKEALIIEGEWNLPSKHLERRIEKLTSKNWKVSVAEISERKKKYFEKLRIREEEKRQRKIARNLLRETKMKKLLEEVDEEIDEE